MSSVPEITIYSDSQEQYEWFCSIIEKAQDAFGINAKQAVVKGFQLLEAEVDLHLESLKKVHHGLESNKP